MMQGLILAAVATLAAAAAQAEEIYSRQPTWAAGMTASLRNLTQTPLKDIKLAEWRASDPLPAESVADEPVALDKVTPKAKGADGNTLLHSQRHWSDGDVHGLDLRPKTLRYLYREIRVGTPGAEEIAWGCDGPAVLWLNGGKVYSGGGSRPCKPGQQRIRIDLRKGANTLIVKVFRGKDRGAFCFEVPGAKLDRDTVCEALCRRFWEDYPETDWFMQDNPLRPVAVNDFNPRRDFGWYFEPGRDSSAEQKMIRRALDELGDAGTGPAARLEALVKANPPVSDPAWLDLYVEACGLRRQKRLAAAASRVPEIVFTKHYTLGGSHYAYTEGQSDAQAERHFIPGAALCLMKWDGSAYRTEELIGDPKGIIRDPDVSYDARRVLFAWKKSDRQDDYHLYEMDMATRQVRQLTEGLGAVDYEGAYLPDGDILFNSTRCVQTVDCWWTEVSNLYRCDRDGRFLRRLTFDQVHDNYPAVTGDGRILYTRWEYNDRGQIYTQPLLQMNADGTNQTEYYGGNSFFPTTILHARMVPGREKVVAIATGHHSRQTGKLILIDPSKGRQENSGVLLIAPPRPTAAAKIDGYGQEGELFQYPYPLSETEYLVTYHPVGWRWETHPYGPRFGIYFMTMDGRRELLVRDAKLPCSQPVPLRARDPGRLRPSPVDYRRTDGLCYIQDVYVGPGLNGVPRGTIKTLRVVALEFRAAGIGSNGNGGPGGGALISTPVSIGNGSWDPKIILGDARIHDDGSAYFRVPARTPVYFQLLDAKGRMVQTMRSWTTLQPGETASCVGCHESKNSAPPAGLAGTQAFEGGAEDLKPFYGKPRGFSFVREIQPILDAKCVRCHDGNEAVSKPPLLTPRAVEDPGAKRKWTEAYLALTHSRPDDKKGTSGWRGNPDHPMLNWVSAQSAPPMLRPNSAGANKSKLFAILDKGHEDVKLSQEEMDKLAAWVDLGVPFGGDYYEANTWNEGEKEKYDRYLAKRKRLEALDRKNIEALIESASTSAKANP
jgi:hypothetical protein